MSGDDGKKKNEDKKARGTIKLTISADRKDITKIYRKESYIGVAKHLGYQAGMLTLMAPLERVRVLLQVQHVHKGIPTDQRFKGFRDCCRRTV